MARQSEKDDITVHVDWLARRLMQQQEDAAAREQHRITMSTHRVSRVPSHLRLAKRDAYSPGLVAIGPLHAGESATRLRPGYRLKMAYLHHLISRGHPDPSTHLAVIQEYIATMAPRDREARAMYAAEDVDEIRAEDFVQMMVLDGCFIIGHLVNVATGHEEQALHATPFGPTQLSVDLVLTENQIPFFVLVDLINKTRLPEFDNTGFTPPVLLMKMALYYLGGEKGRDMAESALPSAEGVSHILHLLHAMVTAARTRWQPPPPPLIQGSALLDMTMDAAQVLRCLPMLVVVSLLYPIVPTERRWRANYRREDLPSASDLKRLSLKFKKTRGDHKSNACIASVLGPVPLSVKLEKEDRLRLPQLRMEYRMTPLLLNLVVFEQLAELGSAGDVSAYACFMAKIVQSPEDAGVLLAAGAVHSGTSGGETNEAVARFFREAGAATEAVDLDKTYLAETLDKLRRRRQQQLFTMWADVQRNYFSEPWVIVAEFVAVVSFLSSVLQIYAALK